MSVLVKTAVRKGEAFIAQILADGAYTDFTADSDVIAITFPDLSVLTIKSTFFTDPNYLTIANIGTKITAYYNANLFGDLQKWGFDTTVTSKFLHISIADLKNADNSAKFTYKDSTGTTKTFDYTILPDGVYKFLTAGDTNPGAVPVDFYSRNLSTAESDAYLATNINSYLTLQVDEAAYQQDIDTLKDLIMKLMIIQYGARYDFNNGYFTNANTKATAIRSIIDTGVYIFKPGH
jgi:hypothetical protein